MSFSEKIDAAVSKAIEFNKVNRKFVWYKVLERRAKEWISFLPLEFHNDIEMLAALSLVGDAVEISRDEAIAIKEEYFSPICENEILDDPDAFEMEMEWMGF